MTNANDSAFPLHPKIDMCKKSSSSFQGLTKREYFIAIAMQGLLAADTEFCKSEEYICDTAISQADLILKKLGESNG